MFYSSFYCVFYSVKPTKPTIGRRYIANSEFRIFSALTTDYWLLATADGNILPYIPNSLCITLSPVLYQAPQRH